jgi:hypothetical protein
VDVAPIVERLLAEQRRMFRWNTLRAMRALRWYEKAPGNGC